mmetsp:Transcript_22816/g.51718  ORF Transcript_22816/g.51718 Transcript_22816/m.51718 type:complete len:213 (+) Transcript_22816:549-1187(+)
MRGWDGVVRLPEGDDMRHGQGVAGIACACEELRVFRLSSVHDDVPEQGPQHKQHLPPHCIKGVDRLCRHAQDPLDIRCGHWDRDHVSLVPSHHTLGYQQRYRSPLEHFYRGHRLDCRGEHIVHRLADGSAAIEGKIAFRGQEGTALPLVGLGSCTDVACTFAHLLPDRYPGPDLLRRFLLRIFHPQPPYRGRVLREIRREGSCPPLREPSWL